MDLPKWVTARTAPTPAEVSAQAELVRRRQKSKNLLSPSARLRLIFAADCCCAYCGGQGDSGLGPDGKKWHMDHRTPLSRGGSIHLANIAVSCSACNALKGTMTDVEFLQFRAMPSA